MTTALPLMIGDSPSTERWPDSARARRYCPPMTTTAHAVLSAMDVRRPGLRPAKQHLLLFFAQGHHLAWSGTVLFAEDLYATARGVALPEAGREAGEPMLSEAMLGTVTGVVVRYSGLSPADLRTLVQASAPWRLARAAGGDARIDRDALGDWFRRPEETDDPDDERPDEAERAEAEAYLAVRSRAS